MSLCFFFFNDTATTEIYTLSLHDALPISDSSAGGLQLTLTGKRGVVFNAHLSRPGRTGKVRAGTVIGFVGRSEEHTSELQSQSKLVCRLLPEKKNKTTTHL